MFSLPDISDYVKYVYIALFGIAVVLFIRGKIIDAREKKKNQK